MSPRTPAKKRIYKQTPLSERIANAPGDLLVHLNEMFQLCEWDEWLDQASTSIGIASNILFLLVKAYHGDVFTDADDLFIDYTPTQTSIVLNDDEPETSYLSTLSYLIEFLILILSIANTVFLLRRSKPITLFHHPTAQDETRPHDESWNLARKTPHARLVAMDLAATDAAFVDSASDSDDAGTPAKKRATLANNSTPLRKIRDTMANWSPWSAAKGVRRRGVQRGGGGEREKVKMEFHWVVAVWDPARWSLNLFCWTSPPAMFALYAMNYNNWNYLLPIALFIHGMLHVLVRVFLEKLVDQDILNSQLQKEYNSFVYSLPPFRQAVTVGVQVGTRG
ncbi:hypothetical protein HDU98_011631 [Podochytrium sp. JEL0797]|nr:hypothetical protein HDU98_011631 [Podochytrium sp. JEL0797]